MKRILTIALLGALTCGISAGCSQTKVSSMNTSKSLSGSELDTFGNKLKADLVADGVLERARRKAGHEPVIMFTQFRNRTNDRKLDNSWRILYNSLESAMVNTGLATVTEVISTRDGNYDADLKDANKLDSDPDFDQSTGTVASGARHKPDLAMSVEIVSAKSTAGKNTEYFYNAQVRFAEVGSGTLVWSGRITLNKEF